MAVALRRREAVRGEEAIAERPDGSRFPFLPYPTPIFDDEGEMIGAVNLLVDVSERARADEPAHRLAAIVDSAEDAIIGKDLNGIIRTWNAAAERVFGYAAEEIVGRSILTLIPEERRHEEDAILAKLRSGQRVEHFETVRQKKDGTLIDMSLTISPIKDARGGIVGASKIARDITDRKRWERVLQKHAHRLSMLNRVARELSKDLDLERIVRTAVDLATDLSEAKWGAFFYTVNGEHGAPHVASAFSKGAEKFARLVAPRDGEPLEEAFRGWRAADIRNDAHYRGHALFRTLPGNDPHIVSFLSVPVVSASGRLLGGLMFAHNQPDAFSNDSELIVSSIAAQAGLALENAKLHRSAQIEIEHRKKAEAEKQLLVNEIRHRIKNTLGMVQAMARQTLHSAPAAERDAFVARLHAMNDAHDLLTQRDWQFGDMRETVERALRPFGAGAHDSRLSLAGPDFTLTPNKTLFVAMLLHELGTNAVKYGALSTPRGRIAVVWEKVDESGRNLVVLRWQESGGPKVVEPARRGFGSRLIESVLKAEQGSAERSFAPEGFRCTLRIAL